MARKQKLKVYRTPIGFDDAYVAAPSQKAALEAWGSDVDLFARGVAEVVTDESLAKEPLENPGTVIRRRRGTSDAFMAALPKDRPHRRRVPRPAEDDGPPPRRRSGGARTGVKKAAEQVPKPAARPEPEAIARPQRRARPRPSRAKLEAAEAAVEQAQKKHEAEIAEIRELERALQARRRELERAHEIDTAKLEKAVERQRALYDAALSKWRG